MDYAKESLKLHRQWNGKVLTILLRNPPVLHSHASKFKKTLTKAMNLPAALI